MPLTDKQKIGFAGENAAARFLMKHGFAVLDRNYRKKWGEIDIVAKKEGIIHFVEVKAVSHETNNYGKNGFRPEENVHFWKLKRLSRAIQTYLIEKDVPHETEWQIDVMAVFLDLNRKKATIRMTENVII
ncbi:MAG: YraN family protein [Candidatus Pacebacteria bacterium]|nr:YraN family protein [Candidatus Paceibacterota bacterium]